MVGWPSDNPAPKNSVDTSAAIWYLSNEFVLFRFLKKVEECGVELGWQIAPLQSKHAIQHAPTRQKLLFHRKRSPFEKTVARKISSNLGAAATSYL
jgi:hypothetical protein